MSQPAIRQVAGAPRKNFWNTGASTGQLKSEPILAPAGSCRFEGTISRREPTCTTRQCASAGSGGGGVQSAPARIDMSWRIKAGGKARGRRGAESAPVPHCDRPSGWDEASPSWPCFSARHRVQLSTLRSSSPVSPVSTETGSRGIVRFRSLRPGGCERSRNRACADMVRGYHIETPPERHAAS
jgi:hypothetical protein